MRSDLVALARAVPVEAVLPLLLLELALMAPQARPDLLFVAALHSCFSCPTREIVAPRPGIHARQLHDPSSTMPESTVPMLLDPLDTEAKVEPEREA